MQANIEDGSSNIVKKIQNTGQQIRGLSNMYAKQQKCNKIRHHFLHDLRGLVHYQSLGSDLSTTLQERLQNKFFFKKKKIMQMKQKHNKETHFIL